MALKRALSSLAAPCLMGILNLTPDSFSDGARYLDPERAVEHADRMVKAGAGIIDLGGESTRPGSEEVPPAEEIQRILPVLRILRKRYPHIELSIDTRHSETAEAAIEAGADIINDISALRHDPDMAAVLAAHSRVKVILMHMQGQPQTMQDAPHYDDLVGEINGFFAQRIEFCEANGIGRPRLMLDPGIGFGKTLEHNLKLLAAFNLFREHGLPLVLGASRKRFIDAVFASGPDQRLAGSLAAGLAAALQGDCILRVHDVFEHAQFFAVLKAILEAS